MRQLLSAAQVRVASAAVAAGTTLVTGSTIDTLGFEDVTILCELGAITATGVPTLKAQQGAASDGSDAADLEGSAVAGDDGDSNKILAIEIHRPKERYITPVLTRATANVVVKSILVILSGAANTPVAQADIAGSVALNTPGEGTA